jgi:N-acetylmuramoyl-L-alanine amidase
VHFNSLEDSAVHGTEVYYSDTGPQAERGRDLAEHLLSALVDQINAEGYPGVSRGVRSDRYQRYPPDVQAAFQRHCAS